MSQFSVPKTFYRQHYEIEFLTTVTFLCCFIKFCNLIFKCILVLNWKMISLLGVLKCFCSIVFILYGLMDLNCLFLLPFHNCNVSFILSEAFSLLVVVTVHWQLAGPGIAFPELHSSLFSGFLLHLFSFCGITCITPAGIALHDVTPYCV